MSQLDSAAKPHHRPWRARLRAIRPALRHQRRRLGVGWRNWRRRRRQATVDYIIFPLGGPLPERALPRRSFIERRLPLPPRPLSLQTLAYNVDRVIDADNVHGVVFILRGLSAATPRLQSVRALIRRLRAAGKHVVVYTPYLDLRHYYVASAADTIVAPPAADFAVVGVQATLTHYRDALAKIGVSAEFVQISPYKASANPLTTSAPTPEEIEQQTWLLDDRFELLVDDIAADRGLTPDAVRAAVDAAPFTTDEARDRGLIDHVAYDDELARLLRRPPTSEDRRRGWFRRGSAPAVAAAEEGTTAATDDADSDNTRPARLVTIGAARRDMLEKVRRRSEEVIAVVSLNGPIQMGSGQVAPIPLSDEQPSGEATIARTLRWLEQEDDVAALVLCVDSPGGDALASDLIQREVARVARRLPVVVYMGDVAASGGYYVSAPAAHIVAQPATITGSIGVLVGRFSTEQLRLIAGVQTHTIKRGANAGLFRDMTPLTSAERDVLWRSIETSYARFKDVVAAGRDLSADALEPICGGRIWTGRQALAHGLVDSLGDFAAAVARARALAELPDDDAIEVPVVNFYHGSGSYKAPSPFPEAESLARRLNELLRGETLAGWNGRPLYWLPFDWGEG